jgi:hypothetical protein
MILSSILKGLLVMCKNVGAALREVDLITAVHDQQVVRAAPRLAQAQHRSLLVFGLAFGDAVHLEVDSEVDDVVRKVRHVLALIRAENQVHPVETSAHDAFSGVTQVEGVAQLVQHRPESGRVATTECSSAIKIFYKLSLFLINNRKLHFERGFKHSILLLDMTTQSFVSIGIIHTQNYYKNYFYLYVHY